jgi:hypothetical protein
MISDLDIWRAANLLIRRQGGRAVSEATRLACRMPDRGDACGGRRGARIGLAVEVPQARQTELS